MDRPLLAFDTGSPRVSVALVAPDLDPRTPTMLAERTLDQRASSTALLPAARAVLAEAGLGLGDLGGLVVLRGPGSFTGLRIGLATVMGLEQATGLPIAAGSTLHALAAAGAARANRHPGTELTAAVDALRGEWTTQRFAIGQVLTPLSKPVLVSAADLGTIPGVVVGFGCERLSLEDSTPPSATFVEPPPLARWAAQLALTHPALWDKALLMRPLYARAPAVTMPAPTPIV